MTTNRLFEILEKEVLQYSHFGRAAIILLYDLINLPESCHEQRHNYEYYSIWLTKFATNYASNLEHTLEHIIEILEDQYVGVDKVDEDDDIEDIHDQENTRNAEEDDHANDNHRNDVHEDESREHLDHENLKVINDMHLTQVGVKTVSGV